MVIAGNRYKIGGESRYFTYKYGEANPEILIEAPMDYHRNYLPAAFLFKGRALAEGVPIDSNIYYGKIDGVGEFVHESELIDIT